jgi:glycosyl hydrolase family 123
MLRGVVTAVAALALVPAAGAGVLAYPSSQTIPPAGALPQGGSPVIGLNAAIGEREGAWLVVRGARSVSASIDTSQLGPLKAALYFGHFVKFGGRAVPDALMPWDGGDHPTERPNQPLYLQVLVPADAKPGGYRAVVRVTADGSETSVPVTITVFDVRLPSPSAASGNLLTSFHLSAQSYVNKVDQLYRLGSNPARAAANDALYSFLAGYRISPAGWGFGEPKKASGYEPSRKWWLDAAGNMARQAAAGFATMRVPISSQRTTQRNWIAGISPFQPQTWCNYLGAVRSFWEQHDWLNDRVPYLYTLDEPGLEGQRLVARQAAAGHSCFAGSKVLLTGNPTPANRFLWDNRGGDDVDIWVVLSRRFYGQFTNPKAKVNRARRNLASVDGARKAGKMLWSYTYSGVPGAPGYTAAEPLSNPRMLQLWNALEGIQGTLYGQGTTSYTKANPLESVANNGEFVLLYPGPTGPIASARLEQIRDGIEDWDVVDLVRRGRGAAAVRTILAGAGLFSATPQGVKLACHLGCELPAPTKYAWPQWSHDASTAEKIEEAHLRALRLADR